MRLLLTRPEQDAARTAGVLRGAGHAVLIAPMLRIEPVANDLGPGPFDAVLITSRNAARAAAAHPCAGELLGRPVLAVGRRSAEAARQAGFRAVASADGDVAALCAFAAGRLAVGSRVLHLAGEERAGDLAGCLARRGFQVCTVVVYRAVAAERLPPDVEAALSAGAIDGVLHYSPRSAAAFLACAGRAGLAGAALRPTHYCLSAAVAAPLAAAGAATRVAAAPDEPALLRLLLAAPSAD